MKTTTLRLPETLREELEAEARERDITFAEHVRQILHARGELDLETPNASRNASPNAMPNALPNTIEEIEQRVSALEERLDQRNTSESRESSDSTTLSDSGGVLNSKRMSESGETVSNTGFSESVQESTPAIEDVIEDWRPGRSTERREERRRAGKAALEFLRDRGVASASEFKEIEPSNSVSNQSVSTWWRKTAREALQRAQERGLCEFVDGKKEWHWRGE